jgi:hypothetical protein
MEKSSMPCHTTMVDIDVTIENICWFACCYICMSTVGWLLRCCCIGSAVTKAQKYNWYLSTL